MQAQNFPCSEDSVPGSVYRLFTLRPLRARRPLPLACVLMKGMFQTQMNEVKDKLRATVRIGYDGRVSKTYRGPKAAERFDTEVRVLRHLEAVNCPNVLVLPVQNQYKSRILATDFGT